MLCRHGILVVINDVESREFLIDQLVKRGGFSVTGASTIQEAETRATAQRDQLGAIIITDTFPDGHGANLVIALRRRSLPMPIIRLTDSPSEPPADLGWMSEVHMVNPVPIGVLLESLVAQLRIFESGDSAVLPLGPYSFRTTSRSLYLKTGPAVTKLSEKEGSLLRSLFRARGQVVLRQRLLEEIWGGSASETTHSVETHIYRLRRKLLKNALEFEFIVTEPGGYRLAVSKRR